MGGPGSAAGAPVEPRCIEEVCSLQGAAGHRFTDEAGLWIKIDNEHRHFVADAPDHTGHNRNSCSGITSLSMRIALVVAVVMAAAVLAAASPAHADEISCPITGTAPASVTLGTSPEQVQFDVMTACDSAHPVNWALESDITPYSSGHSWLLLRNYAYPGGEKFTYHQDPSGYFTIDPLALGNDRAGVRPLYASAFYDANRDGIAQEPVSSSQSSFVLRRSTTFREAGPDRTQRRRMGESIKISAAIQRANWNTGSYDAYTTSVMLQFRPNGAASFENVKPVWNGSDGATAWVTAERSGTWRYHFDGDATSGPSDSSATTVTVTRCHGRWAHGWSRRSAA